MKTLVIGNADRHPERHVKQEKFLSVIDAVSDESKLISGTIPEKYADDIKYNQINHAFNKRSSRSISILNFVIIQLKILLEVVKSRNFDCVVLFMGYPAGALAGNLLRMDTIRFHGGPSPIERDLSTLNWLISEYLVNELVETIIVPSESCIDHFDLENHAEKIKISPFHIGEEFKHSKPYGERPYDICYIGEMSTEKGVDILIDAIKHINTTRHDSVQLVLCGRGDLVKEYADILDEEYIDYRGWVNHSKLPEILNNSRSFVQFSESEGLPTVILESLACGTPVLAKPVGGVSDIIIDGKNGRLYSPSNPEHASEKILEFLETDDLEAFSSNAQNTIDKKYRLQPTIDRFREILTNEECSSD